ncbi:Ragulator complex protein LAMTOR3, partial [Lemmus lemmus]
GFTKKGVHTRTGTSSAVGVRGEKEGAGASGASSAAVGAARRRGFLQASPELPNRREQGYRKFFLERRGGHESCDGGLTGGFREATELRGRPGRSPQVGAREGLPRSPLLPRGDPFCRGGRRWAVGAGHPAGFQDPDPWRSPGTGEGGSRDAGSGKGNQPGVLGESQKFLFQAYKLILREKGVHHGGLANDSAPEHALRPGFLSTFALATDQGSKLGLSKNKSIICYYNTYQVVQFNRLPLVVSFIASSNANTGLIVSLEKELAPLFEELIKVVEVS